MSRHALIGGGTGFIGTRLAKHLSKDGYNITIVSRMPGVNHISWHDLERTGIPTGVSTVVNLAGQNVLDPSRRWTPGFKQNVWNSRVNTTAAMAKALSTAPEVKSFINICGVSHYKPIEKMLYTEDDIVVGYDFMSNLCLEWENAAKVPMEVTRRCREVKIRTGVVLGREGGMIKSIWLPFKLGLGGPLGNGEQILPWIHVEDLCRLIHYCIECETCEGVLNAVAPEVVTNQEFSKTFANALHRPCLFAVPEFIVRLIFGTERSALLLSGAQIQPKRTIETGFQFKYPTAKLACEAVVKSAKLEN